MSITASFRLYQNIEGSSYEATLFDLFSGKGEVKQTKALAYALKSDPKFLGAFVKRFYSDASKSLKHATYVEVIAELMCNDGARADIVIKLCDMNGVLIVLVVEAKGASVVANTNAVTSQLSKYEKLLSINTNVPVYGATLTKNKVYASNRESITWDDVVTLVAAYSKQGFYKELLEYLTKVEGGMKYYEKEVLSIPAGDTIEMIRKYNVYACPANEDYNFKKSLFITFRAAGGGVMRDLYKVDYDVIINPNETEAMKRLKQDAPKHYRKIFDYCDANKLDVEHRFFVLSDEVISLIQEPRPPKNNSYTAYYTIFEIMTQKILPSKKQGKIM